MVKFILLMPYIPGWCPNSSAPTKNGDRNNGSDTVNWTYTLVVAASAFGTPDAVIPPSARRVNAVNLKYTSWTMLVGTTCGADAVKT
jgi:hypothetical protein